MDDFIVVGGGITGLAAALRLQQRAPEAKIRLLEAGATLGGKVQTERIDGFTIEAGPDCFLSRKPRGLGLTQELSLESELCGRVPENKRTFVRRNGRLHDLPAGLTGLIPTDVTALKQSSLLSADGIQAVADEPSIPALNSDADESIASFVQRRFGTEVFANLIEPLMGGIYAGKADQLSILATFPQLRRMEATHGSLLKGLETVSPPESEYPPFVSFRDGTDTLISKLMAEISVPVHTNTPVVTVEKTADFWKIRTEQKTYKTRALILATPAYISANLLSTVNAQLSTALRAIPHASVALVTLAFDEADLTHPLKGYGYVVPAAEKDEVLACTWSSRKWANRAPAGKVLLRVYIGRYGNNVTTYDDDHLLALAQTELANTLGIRATPCLTHFKRWPNGMPQYNMGHLDRLATIEQHSMTGLALAGAYFRGVGLPDCILSGEMAAERLIDRNL